LDVDFLHETAKRFRKAVAADIDWVLRLVAETRETFTVRQGIADPPALRKRLGACISCREGSGWAYAATGDIQVSGLLRALGEARGMACRHAGQYLFQTPPGLAADESADYSTSVEQPWDSWHASDKIDYLHRINQALCINPEIIDWSASLDYRKIEVLLAGADSTVSQTFELISPSLTSVASRAGQTQIRTYGHDLAAQAGLEHLDRIGFTVAAGHTAEQALQLLDAQECPADCCDVLLLPSQMALQIHESIGHPLELDRILGDERNYAGTSFISLDDFGHYRYGSDLLNVVFDPGFPNELASYACDDEGTAAQREYLIKQGILLRPLGGRLSQYRAGLPGVANSRSCSWNRPPIDRMANINIEPNTGTMDDLVAGIENGVMMETNRSWSIDDSRNKFQFGCEYGRLIRDGELRDIIRNPNYRGISATFWQGLKAVGGPETFAMHGVLTCGKGEPNQALHAGHAAPACVFSDVTVFGGD
jgi:predicted Zn-dependent protease